MSTDGFRLLLWGLGSAGGIYWVGAGGAANWPTMHRTAPTTKSDRPKCP